jgi:RecB family endonuclease NucS
MRFEKIPVLTKAGLRSLVVNDVEAIEEGLKLIAHHVKSGAGSIDVLCTDAEKRLTIILLKDQKNGRTILKALDYYDWINKNVSAIKRMYPKSQDIDANKSPRLIFLGSEFSDDFVRSVKYLKPRFDLVECEYLKTPNGEKGLYCRNVDIEETRRDETPSKIEEEVRSLFKNSSDRIKDAIDRIKKIK